MIGDLSNASGYYIVCGKTDLRASIDGLASVITNKFNLDPFNHCAFFFCGGSRSKIKVLLWEDTGFVLLYKRFEAGKLKWPRNKEEVRALTNEQVNWLLSGLAIDQPNLVQNFIPMHRPGTNEYRISM